MEFLSNYLIDNNITDIISAYKYQLYGIFGMPIFMGFLAYLIVKYKAFNIKMIGAQALIFALIVLVGSQFFFAQNNTSKILTGITLVFTGAFGIFLIRSVHEEVKRKEELQYMSDKLAQANDQLRTLDNAKSEFISIASHQLRTPLTSIKGFISLLLEGAYGKFAENQSDVLNKVYKSNERLITLVEDLLNISRIESGRMEFHFEKCQLTVLCQELMDTFSMRAKTSGLYLDYKVPQNPIPEVMVDSAKVREVISNLIDNAIKYTPKGGVTIRVEQADPRLSKIENVGKMGSVRVVISDTGIGVPATEIPYLFSKFSRGKDTGRLNTGGTGLGLYVGKSMIEANGGKVWAESEGAGKGSRFIIEVPVEQTKENLDKWK
jgi:signal transduction histidine kinase